MKEGRKEGWIQRHSHLQMLSVVQVCGVVLGAQRDGKYKSQLALRVYPSASATRNVKRDAKRRFLGYHVCSIWIPVYSCWGLRTFYVWRLHKLSPDGVGSVFTPETCVIRHVIAQACVMMTSQRIRQKRSRLWICQNFAPTSDFFPGDERFVFVQFKTNENFAGRNLEELEKRARHKPSPHHQIQSHINTKLDFKFQWSGDFNNCLSCLIHF